MVHMKYIENGIRGPSFQEIGVKGVERKAVPIFLNDSISHFGSIDLTQAQQAI